MSNRGLLIIVSGPSGAGKGTVCRHLESLRDDLYISISATTRKPRDSEIDGVHYHFLSSEEFLRRKEDNEFLEWASYNDNYYGTLKQHVYDNMDNGKNVLLEIEVQGALKVRAMHPEGVYVFVLPPSIEELRSRLVKRQSETAETIERRLKTAFYEAQYISKYNYILLNEDAQYAASMLSCIIDAESMRMERNSKLIKEVFSL